MNLKMEVLDELEAPLSMAEGIGLAGAAFGAGILIGIAIT